MALGFAHMCSAPPSMNENLLWNHYNDMMAMLDAKQIKEWHDMANSVLIFVRPLRLVLYFPCSLTQVVGSPCISSKGTTALI